MYRIISTFLYLIVRIFRLLRVEGKDHLPSDEKYVITCTHKGWVDVIMLALAVYPTGVHFMAKKELFNSKLTNKLLRSLNAFPVNRENPGPSTLKTPLKLLKNHKCIGIFPSGTRTNEEAPIKKGAVTNAIKSKSPLIPAVYHGPSSFSGFLRGQKSTIIIGNPIPIKEDLQKDQLIDATLAELDTVMKSLSKQITNSK